MIYTNIRRIAADKGLRIKEIEAAAELPENTMNRWDRCMPAADKLARVAKVLEITVEELLADPEEQTPDAV